MAKITINVGTTADDGTGDTLRGAFQNVNANFTELYSNVANTANLDLSQYYAANASFSTANLAYGIANLAYDKANSANLLAYESNNYTVLVGAASNAYADVVGAASNTYADTIGLAGNNYSIQVGAAANTWSNSTFYTIANGSSAFNHTNASFDYANAAYLLANSAFNYANAINDGSNNVISFNHANAAFDKANAANVLAYDTGISINAYAVTVGAASNNYANITFSSIIDPTFINNITVNKTSNLGGVVERLFSNTSSITGNINFDCSNNHIFYLNNITGPFTPNLQNLSIVSNTATSLTFIIDQGASANITSNNVLIGASNLSINWQGGSYPTRTPNKKDVVTISIFNVNGSNTILGQSTSFG